MGAAGDRGDCNEVQEVRRVWGGIIRGQKLGGTQGGFWGREVILEVSRNLVCCRGFYAIKRFLMGVIGG